MESRKIIRVFPRRTACTPDDELAIIARAPFFFEEADEVHISVAFSWDIPMAERLEKMWRHVGTVSVGGPAMGSPAGAFIPGRYIKSGYTITSRGCPNRCWFCDVWKREGDIHELDIKPGCNVLDSNLLACYEKHIRAVFSMLNDARKIFGRRIEFTGGLEAARLKQWHAIALRELKPVQMFFTYDEPKDYEPLYYAGKMLLDAGFTVQGHRLRAYVLCGYKGDTIRAADKRMRETLDAGFIPCAMLWRGKYTEEYSREWLNFRRSWIRPAIIGAMRQMSIKGW